MIHGLPCSFPRDLLGLGFDIAANSALQTLSLGRCVDARFVRGFRSVTIIEKHYRSSSTRAICETFWEEVCKYPRREVRRELHLKPAWHSAALSLTPVFWCGASQDVPPIIPTSKFYLFSIYRNGLFFLANVASEVNRVHSRLARRFTLVYRPQAPPLYIIEFLHRVFDIFRAYFDVVDEATIKRNFSTVYQVCEPRDWVARLLLGQGRSCSCQPSFSSMKMVLCFLHCRKWLVFVGFRQGWWRHDCFPASTPL